MITTGVEALDGRLGSLVAGATYAFFGPTAGGKSILGLHFLINGLERNERCVLVTRDESRSIDSDAAFVGYGPTALTAHPRLQVIRWPERLPTNTGAAPGEVLVEWLAEQIGSELPRRLVLDDVESLVEYSHTPRALLQGMVHFIAKAGATTYVLVKTERDESFDRITYDPIVEHAAGTFVLRVSESGERTFVFHSPPRGTFRSEPLPYTLRTGGGFSEELRLTDSALDPADRKRVMVLDEIGALSAEVLSRLGDLYELEVLSNPAGALSKLSPGRYGALIIAVDPFDEWRAFDLTFALRKEGNAAPIVFVAPSLGLRSGTRSRGLRTGGDDFFSSDLPSGEIIERIQMSWLRGSHRRSGLSQLGQIIQPVNGNGLARAMTEAEFLENMTMLLREEPPLFFCYLEFTLREAVADLVWPALRTRVRIGDGDIIGMLSGQRYACVLDRITPDQTTRVLDRIRAGHPALNNMEEVVVLPSPMKSEAIRARLRLEAPATTA